MKRTALALAALVLALGAPGVRADEDTCPPIDVYSGPAVGDSAYGANIGGLCPSSGSTDVRYITPGAQYVSVRYLIHMSNVEGLLVTIDGLGFQNQTMVAYPLPNQGGYQTAARQIPDGQLASLAPGVLNVRVQGPGVDATTRYRTITTP